MTFDEMMELQKQSKPRRKPSDEEHRIQSACVRWFRLQYPKMKHNLFSVPNGGKRDAVTGAKLKEEGALAGVADLILLKSHRFYGALLIELKTSKGSQSDSQKEWQDKITKDGYKYVVIRSLDEFMQVVKQYLSDE